MSDSQIPTGDQQPTGTEATTTMTIGELSRISGLSPSAIRFYQRRGVLPARDADGGWQRYGHEAVDRLAVIELAKRAAFSLDEIIRLMDAMDTDPDSVPADTPIWHGLAESKIDEIDASIRRLQQMRQLLRDALDCGYLSADRIRQVPITIGWTAGEAEAPLPTQARIPTSTRDLDLTPTNPPAPAPADSPSL